MKNDKKQNKISVRLTPEAAEKLNDAVNKGYSKSAYINNLIVGSKVMDLNVLREISAYIFNAQSELELITDLTAKNNIRKELDQTCRALKSSLKTT